MSIEYVDINRLRMSKTSDTLVILGSGPSINDLSETFWEWCDIHDTMAINNWIYHWYIPTYWSLEVRADQAQLNAWKENLQEKEKYENVIWLIEYKRVGKGELLLKHIRLNAKIFKYRVALVNNKNWVEHLRKTNKLFNDPDATSCMDYSLPRILPIVVELGYKKIILAGVDLSNSLYFWSNDEITVHKRFNGSDDMTLESAMKEQHNAQKPCYNITRVLTELQNEFLVRQNVELYVLNKESCLYPSIKFFDVNEEIEKWKET